MNIYKAIENSFKRAKEKNWYYVVFLIDIHDTIFKATYSEIENFEYLGKAKEALQLMSARPDIKIILWSSTFSKNKYILKLYHDNINIDAFNGNIDEIENTEIACFYEKPYFNVGIDNAFGFDPETDWEEVIKSLNNNQL